MTFDSERLLIVAIYIWLSLASYVVFLTTLVWNTDALEATKSNDGKDQILNFDPTTGTCDVTELLATLRKTYSSSLITTCLSKF